MVLKELKNHCLKRLSVEFPTEECQSFFYILSEYILKLNKVEVVLNLQQEIAETDVSHFNQIINKLLHHEPIQYIIGATEFYGLQIQVNEHVLIPRPETEELVDWIIKDVDNVSSHVLDIGTGSGCIAIALAKHLHHCKIDALDVSNDALKVAKTNAESNQATIDFRLANILEPISFEKKYDIIVSNPPYVKVSEQQYMKKNVLEHEPYLALFVNDDDALLFYRKIICFAKKALNLKGVLYFEINEHLGSEMIQLMEENGFSNVELKQDVFGKDRMIKGVRS